MRALLLAVVACAVAYDTVVGLRFARARRARVLAFESDVRAGAPPSLLIARHQRTLLPFPEDGGTYAHDALMLAFERLRRDGYAAFASLAPEPPLVERPLSALAEPAIVRRRSGEAAWDWTLPSGTRVAGVRVSRPSVLPGDGGGWVLEWRRGEGEPYTRERRHVKWWNAGEEVATAWIHDTVRTLRAPKLDGSPPAITVLQAP